MNRKEEIEKYGFHVVMATDLVISLMPAQKQAKHLKALEQVGKVRYGRMTGLVIALLKEQGMSEAEAVVQWTREVGKIIFWEDVED